MAHSVESHLGMQAAEYDRVIRTFIPDYEKMLATIAWWLQAIMPPAGKVIDLGGGTGALAHALLTRLPQVQLEIWDVDAKMLQVARERLSPFGARVTLVERSFTTALPPCDAVVASLALHHIPELAAKRAVYANIYAALPSPGVFLNGDATVAAPGPGRDGSFRLWADFMQQQGASAEQAQKHFADWLQEDTYFPLSEEFGALAAAGFQHPECFWKEGPIGVYGGIK